MRLSHLERKALHIALDGFEGEVYIFGSRLYDDKKGGDIDILLKPLQQTEGFAISSRIRARFFMELDQDIDVMVYKKDDLFSQDVMKNAQRITVQDL